MPWYRLSLDVFPLLIIVSPLVGMIITIVAARWNQDMVRPLAISNSTFTLFLIAVAICFSHSAEGQEQAGTSESPRGVEWLASATATETGVSINGIRVRISWWLNGVSLWTTGLLALVVWTALCRTDDQSEDWHVRYLVPLMICQSLLSASTFSSDGISSIVFLEMAAVPIYLLLGCCGDGSRRQVASGWWTWQWIGGTCSLVGVTLLAVSQPWMQAEFVTNRAGISLDSQFLTQGIQQLLRRSESAIHIWSTVGPWSSLMVLLALLIRLPTFPFQGWYQSTLLSAPTQVSAIIAAAFPLAAFGHWLRWGMPLFGFQTGVMTAILAVVALTGLLYAGLAAQSQSDLKKLLILFSCGTLCVAGISLSFRSVDGVRAAWLMMLSNGLAIPCGLLLVHTIETRARTRDLHQLGAFANRDPRTAVLLNLLLLGWTGVPFLAGFTALYQNLAGASSVGLWLILGEAIGLIALAAAALRAVTLVNNARSASVDGLARGFTHHATDGGNSRDSVILVPYLVLLVALNLVPAYFLPTVDDTIPVRFITANQP